MAEQNILGAIRYVEDEPENFIEDGITVNDTLTGFDPIPKEPPSRASSPSPRSDSGYFDGAAEAKSYLTVPALNGVDLNQTIKSNDSSLVELGLTEEEQAAMQDEKDLKDKADLVEELQTRLNNLSTGGALCTTQLSDEVASKQEVFDQLGRQLHEKRMSERQDKVALFQFRREREEVIFQLNEQLLNAKRKFDDQINSLHQNTEKVKKHLDNINTAFNDLLEKYEDIRTELMSLSEELDVLSSENQRKNEAVSKHNIILRKNKLTTMERLADIADEIEKRNALIAHMKQQKDETGN